MIADQHWAFAESLRCSRGAVPLICFNLQAVGHDVQGTAWPGIQTWLVGTLDVGGPVVNCPGVLWLPTTFIAIIIITITIEWHSVCVCVHLSINCTMILGSQHVPPLCR